MKGHKDILNWATNYLLNDDNSLVHDSEIVVATPWSNVIRLSSSKGNIYLKQSPPSISQEANILHLMRTQFHASVPLIITVSDEHHCFLMRDAGSKLRAYLKNELKQELLCQAVR